MKLPSLFTAVLLLLTAATAEAQYPKALPPEPLPMGVPYAYQIGNPYRTNYTLLMPSPSPYPFGATRPVFGRYSWDYSSYFPSGIGYYTPGLPYYPYSFAYPSLPGRVGYGYGW